MNIYEYISHSFQIIFEILLTYTKLISNLVTKDNDKVWIVPAQVIFTTIGSILSALIILGVSSLYNKRRDRKKLIKERSEYEPFIYQYLTDIAQLSERQAYLIDEYVSRLEANNNIGQWLVQVPKTSVKYFLQIQPNVIYNSLFLNKVGDAKERTKVYSAIINAISTLDSSLENISENYKDFNLLYHKSINCLNEYLDEFQKYHDNVLANREEYLAGSESAFYLALDKVITNRQTKEAEIVDIKSSAEFYNELLGVCKLFDTKATIALTRILININFSIAEGEQYRNQQITLFKQIGTTLRGISLDIKGAIESSKQMPLIK